jgi:hypothetical protein
VHCDRAWLVPLRDLRHPPETPVWKLEAALYCEPCSKGWHPPAAGAYSWTYARPDPEGATGARTPRASLAMKRCKSLTHGGV